MSPENPEHVTALVEKAKVFWKMQDEPEDTTLMWTGAQIATQRLALFTIIHTVQAFNKKSK